MTLQTPTPARRAGSLALLALAASLSACSLVPTYERPAAPVASQWPSQDGMAAAPGESAAELPWQDFVQDAGLRELITLALANNRDLRVAIANIEQARAQYQIRRADQVPSLNGALTGSRSAPNPYEFLTGKSVASSYGLSVGVTSWELDFFGRVAALKDAALAQYLATDEARKTTQISLIANIASTWLQLKTDTELQLLAERTLATREQSLQLTKLRFDNGASSALDMRQAESLAASARATRAQQQRLRAQDFNLLTLLVGQPLPERLVPALPQVTAAAAPRSLSEPTPAVQPAAELPGFAPVPAGLPSDLLLRRPDVRAAERDLAAATARIGVATADLFPKFSLTGAFSGTDDTFPGLRLGANHMWSIGPSIQWPVFDAGRIRANISIQNARQEQALLNYEKTVLISLEDVENALVRYAKEQNRLVELTTAVEASQKALDIANDLYKQGLVNFLNVLDAERTLFAAEDQRVQSEANVLTSLVALYKALGGGWETAPNTAEQTEGLL